MKKIAYDSMQMDSLKIVEDTKCCLKVNAVISKAGVYRYDDGWARKSRMELLKATRTARYAKLTIGTHPESKVIMSQQQIHGGVEKPFFDRDKIRATLNFDKYTVPPDFINYVRTAVANKTPIDNSIGFYYNVDATPGVDVDVNTGQRRPFDYDMRDIMIDHVLVVDKPGVQGRCTFPSCGVGVDAMMKQMSMPISHVSSNGGNRKMSEKNTLEFEAFIKDYIAQGHTREQAEEHLKSITGAQEPAAPPPEPTPLQKCVAEQVAAGKTEAEAGELCKAKLAEPAGAQEPAAPPPEPTPLEKCVAEQVEQGKPPEEADEWCKAELAGEHEAADALIERSRKLISMREQAAIEQRRSERRHPL